MSFVSPYIFWALLLLSIPVIIHLFSFRRAITVYFSNTRLLEAVKEETSSKSKLKHLLTLASRILGLLCLIFAFAQPFLKKKNNQNELFTGRSVSVFIDNSFSMEQMSSEGLLLDEAKNSAKNIIGQFKVSDKFQILTNDFEGKHQRLLSQAEALNLIDEIKITPESKNISAILQRQADVLSKSTLSKYRFVISDFQSSILDEKNLKSDTNINTFLIKLNAPNLQNIFVDSVWFDVPIQQLGQSSNLIIRVKNSGDQKAENIRISLKLNEVQKGLSNLDIEAGAEVIDTLTFGIDKLNWNKGVLTLNDHPITFDDQFYFSFKVIPNIPVLILNDLKSNTYIDAFFDKEQYLTADKASLQQLDVGKLANYRTIILPNINSLGSGLSQELIRLMKSGVSVVVFPGENAKINELNFLLSNAAQVSLGALNTQPFTVDHLNLEDPVLTDVFKSVPRNPDLPKVLKYYPILSSSSSREISLVDAGSTQKLYTKFIVGAGNLYLSSVPLSEDFTNLPKNQLFAPLIYRTCLLSSGSNRLSYMLGSNSTAEIPLKRNAADNVLTLKSAKTEFIPEIIQSGDTYALSLNADIKSSGFYSLVQKSNADSALAVLGLNYNRSESNLSFPSKEEFADFATKYDFQQFDIAKSAEATAAVKTATSSGFWRILAACALFFFIAEILILRFWKN